MSILCCRRPPQQQSWLLSPLHDPGVPGSSGLLHNLYCSRSCSLGPSWLAQPAQHNLCLRTQGTVLDRTCNRLSTKFIGLREENKPLDVAMLALGAACGLC